jgi:hypothetical protein
MNTVASIIADIKRVYLNTATDLSQLVTTLENELELQGSQSEKCSLEELLFYCKMATTDVVKNNLRCAEFARLHNKIDPPLHMIPKKKKVTHLVRVK